VSPESTVPEFKKDFSPEMKSKMLDKSDKAKEAIPVTQEMKNFPLEKKEDFCKDQEEGSSVIPKR